MGTFIEIQCENGSVLKGESILSCIDSGSWDSTMPECVLAPTTVKSTSTEKIITITAVYHDNSTPYKVKQLPDKQFWINLQQLFYCGCSNENSKPIFCGELQTASYYSDLTLFEMPETSDFKHMDRNLYDHLLQASHQLDTQTELELGIEHLFPFILYGNKYFNLTEHRMSQTMENAYRFVLGLYIDTILMDKNLNLTWIESVRNSDENITQKLKYLIVRAAAKVFETYSKLRLKNAKNEISLTTTEVLQDFTHGNIVEHTTKVNTTSLLVESEREPNEENCLLESIPDIPSNSIISEVKIDEETIFKMPDRLYLIGPVSIRTRAYFSCKDGFRSPNENKYYFECSEKLVWIGHQIECQSILVHSF